jgi:hypothetical protein
MANMIDNKEQQTEEMKNLKERINELESKENIVGINYNKL